MTSNVHKYNYKTKILEIDAQEKLEIPIVIYPPFKLRSSLYDKDPVIWVHLLESYIRLIQYFLSFEDGRPLDAHFTETTITQLKQWVQRYLLETSDEQSQILTLGAVNPQINENNALLRSLVFALTQKYGLMYFNISGETLWHYVRVYIRGNSHAVRELILGSKNTGNLSSVNSLVNYLEDLLANDKFHKDQVEYYGILLGVVNRLDNAKVPDKNNKTKNNFFETRLEKFVDTFVNVRLIKMLERYYAGGSGIHSKASKALLVITILSCSADKLFTLVNDQIFLKLVVKNKRSFIMEYPLLFVVLKSDFLKIYKPDIAEKLEFLFSAEKKPKVSLRTQEKLDQLTEMFPHLSLYQTSYLLKQNNHDTNKVTEILLEDPTVVDKIPIESTNSSSLKKATQRLRSKYDNDEFAKLQFNSKNVILGKKQRLSSKTLDVDDDDDEGAYALRKKTLSRALSLLYESDEDEPDDTYLESEIINSEQNSNISFVSSNKGKAGKNNLVSDYEADDEQRDLQAAKRNKEEQIEMILFQTFKKDPSCAERTADIRRSAQRKRLLKETGWTHEQIEGWYRMLSKSPKKVKLLEDKLLFGGGTNSGTGSKTSVILPRSSYRKKKYEEDFKDETVDETPSRNTNQHSTNKNNVGAKNGGKGSASKGKEKNDKGRNSSGLEHDGDTNPHNTNADRQQRKKEQNKSKVANHNRKSAHDKKMSRGY